MESEDRHLALAAETRRAPGDQQVALAAETRPAPGEQILDPQLGRPAEVSPTAELVWAL